MSHTGRQKVDKIGELGYTNVYTLLRVLPSFQKKKNFPLILSEAMLAHCSDHLVLCV